MAERGESTLVGYLPKVLARSAGSTLHLVVAGTSALLAAALRSWAVAALGAVAYVALVAWDVVSPGFWKETLSRGMRRPGSSTRAHTGLARSSWRRCWTSTRRTSGCWPTSRASPPPSRHFPPR